MPGKLTLDFMIYLFSKAVECTILSSIEMCCPAGDALPVTCVDRHVEKFGTCAMLHAVHPRWADDHFADEKVEHVDTGCSGQTFMRCCPRLVGPVSPAAPGVVMKSPLLLHVYMLKHHHQPGALSKG